MSLEDKLISKMRIPDGVEACRKLVNKYFPSLQHAVSQIDVEAIAKQLDIEISYKSALPFDGCLSWDAEGRATMMVSSNIGARRRRFTIAHEIGHWMLQKELLGKKSEPLFRGLSSTKAALSEEERLANAIAAEILLPFDSVKHAIEERKISTAVLQWLSSCFRVSRQAALRRLADVCEIPVVFLNLVPYRFGDLDSRAEVDEAVYVSPGGGICHDREFTRLTKPVRFSRLLEPSVQIIEIIGSRGSMRLTCDVTANRDPVPNADLLATKIDGKSAEAKRFLGYKKN